MEGRTIHWFNLLLETKDDMPWEKLKKTLITCYSGGRLENPKCGGFDRGFGAIILAGRTAFRGLIFYIFYE
jgi:hypothetical protein